jgi:hypothetical protein
MRLSAICLRLRPFSDNAERLPSHQQLRSSTAKITPLKTGREGSFRPHLKTLHHRETDSLQSKAVGKKNPSYTAERRRMSAEFATMRQDEQKLFPPKVEPANSRNSNSTISSTRAKAQLKRTTPRAKLPQNTLNIPILYESSEFVCINKPPSVLSQPGLPGEGTILHLLRYQRPDLHLQTVNRYAQLRLFLTVG